MGSPELGVSDFIKWCFSITYNDSSDCHVPAPAARVGTDETEVPSSGGEGSCD